METKNNETGKRPEKEFSSGAIRATIWNNETIKEGKPVNFRTVSFERSYKDRNGDWKTTSALRVNDIPRASLVLNKAYEYVAMNG